MGTLYQITLVNIVLCVSLFMNRTNTLPVDLTLGFTELPLNTSNFDHHKPYDVPVTQRYSFIDGVHKLWVYSTDKPLSQNSTTRPRSEIRIRGYDYSSGVWQFQGQGFVPYGTSGVCIMQVFGADYPRATTLMVRTYNDTLSYYKAPILVPNIWGRWFQLNVKVYLDGGYSHYFKFGVYTQNDPSNYMESRWRGVRVLKKVYH